MRHTFLVLIVAALILVLGGCPGPASDTRILSFVLEAGPNAELIHDVVGAIASSAVVIGLPEGTAASSLIPTIQLADGATISPASGVAQDFTVPVTYTVVAADGISVSEYEVTTVFLGTDATLSAISLSTGSLLPEFDTGTTDYFVGLPFTEEALPASSSTLSVTVTVTPSDPDASVTIDGTAVAGGSPHGIASLPVGPTTTTITVTAEDGHTAQSYNLELYRAAPIHKTGAASISGYALDSREDGAVQRGVAWPSPRFVDNEDGSLTDQLTGLVWTKDANPYFTANPTDPDSGQMTWLEAVSFGSGSFAGSTGWRLPNIRELDSLVHYGVPNLDSWLTSAGFTNVLGSSSYWSSTTSAVDTNAAFRRILSSGGLYYRYDHPKTMDLAAWPVRSSPAALPATGQTVAYEYGDDGDLQVGVQPPSVRFSDNGDGTITDHQTGLTWLRDANRYLTENPDAPSLGYQDWTDGFDFVDSLNAASYAGHDDWVLPNVHELKSLLRFGEADVAAWLETQGFQNVAAGIYWTSTTLEASTGFAYEVSLYDGEILAHAKATELNPVWPVRAQR